MQYQYILNAILIFPVITECSRYDYLLFENYEVMKKSFSIELDTVRKLQLARKDWYSQSSDLKSTLRNPSNANNGILSLIESRKYIVPSNPMNPSNNFICQNEDSCSLQDSYKRYRKNKRESNGMYGYQDFYSKRSLLDLMKAACEGVIMLQETYDQNITEFSKGHLHIKSGVDKNTRNIDSLKVEDLLVMSNVAFNYYKWYDTAIKYLKEAIKMYYSQLVNSSYAKKYLEIENRLLNMKNEYPLYHNDMWDKKINFIGPDWKMFPHKVDPGLNDLITNLKQSDINNTKQMAKTLEPASNDSKKSSDYELLLKAIDVDRTQNSDYLPGSLREPLFQNICNEKIKGFGHSKASARINQKAKCHFVHHFDPFLSLGPFNLEVKLYYPFRTVVHDFFTEKEMSWMMEYSKPRLTAARSPPASSTSLTKSQLRFGSTTTGFTVTKAVTTWIEDIKYNEEQQYVKVSGQGEPIEFYLPPLKDIYGFSIKHQLLLDISRRIELFTAMNVTTRDGATTYQTTNYGLSGLVVSHFDPWGYEKGTALTDERPHLVRTGDYIATFMGWFEDTLAGGNTGFIEKGYEGVVQPIKGSAAFWINLSSCHYKDSRSQHGGCPVLKGSKWILNKWIYSWDQWKKWPCYSKPYGAIHPFEGMTS